MDNLARCSIAASKMGISYGKYMAMHAQDNAQKKEDVTTDTDPYGRIPCEECGNLFYPARKGHISAPRGAAPESAAGRNGELQAAVLRSHMEQKPIAVLHRETAAELIRTAEKMKISIPMPVILNLEEPVRSKHGMMFLADETGLTGHIRARGNGKPTISMERFLEGLDA